MALQRAILHGEPLLKSCIDCRWHATRRVAPPPRGESPRLTEAQKQWYDLMTTVLTDTSQARGLTQ